MTAPPERLFTIGHGNRSLDELLAGLSSAEIACVIDVRRRPRSRRHPWFSRDALEPALAEAGIGYLWEGDALGGFRDTSDADHHAGLADAGFRAYARHMEQPEFAEAIGRLRQQAETRRCALLCAELDPERCHRRLIADYLTAHGAEVIHLLEPGASRVHPLHPAARLQAGQLIYDRDTQLGLI